MEEAIMIKAKDDAILFADAFDKDRVWLSIQTPSGSMHCTMDNKTAQKLIEALQATMEETA